MEQEVQAFADLVADGEAGLRSNLDRAFLLIAAAAQPGLDVQAELGRLDLLASQTSVSTAEDLARWLFATGMFVGNSFDYYSPENSYLNRVLDTKRGIPISLSVLFIELGRRHGFAIEPVGMPGHFVTQIAPNTFVDAFNGGEILDSDGCERMFQRIAGQRVALPPGALAHTSHVALLHRVIANLRGIGQQRNDAHVTEVAVRLRASFPSPRSAELLELATLLASKSDWGNAGRVADRAADLLPEARAEQVRAKATQWRARLN